MRGLIQVSLHGKLLVVILFNFSKSSSTDNYDDLFMCFVNAIPAAGTSYLK